MDVMPRASPAPASSLNPNAPLFVPLAYRSVEDFSDQWWALIQSSPWFRDYWLQERFSDPQEDSFFPNPDDLLLPDLDSLFDLMPEEEENFEEDEEEDPGYCRDLARTGGLKWRKERAEKPRYAEKVPKIVNVRVTPKTIQQPR